MFNVTAKLRPVAKLKNKVARALKSKGVTSAYLAEGDEETVVSLFYKKGTELPEPKELGSILEPILDMTYKGKKKGMPLKGDTDTFSIRLTFKR